MDKLSPHIVEHYKLINLTPGLVATSIGMFDLRTISKTDADRLKLIGVKFLVPVEKRKPKQKENKQVKLESEE